MSLRQVFNPLSGNFDLVKDLDRYPQVVYVDKSNTGSYVENGSFEKPFKTVKAMYDAITDASGSKKYACIIAPGNYLENPAIRVKGWIDLISFANDTVSIRPSDSSKLKMDNANPGRVFVTMIGFPNGFELLNTTPGSSGVVVDFDNCDIGAITFAGRGGGVDFIQIRNDSRITGAVLIQSAATTFFDSTFLSTLTLNDVGCVSPDSFGSAITATIRSNYLTSLAITSTSFDVYCDIWANNNISTLTITSNSAVPSQVSIDALSYPGTISLSGTPAPIVARTTFANGVGYTPSTPADWSVVPNNVSSALDELATGSGSTVTSASNVGAGSQVFKQLSGTDLEFRTLVAGINIQLVQGTDTITIDNVGIDDGLNLGAGTGVFAQKSGGNLEFKSLTAGTNITLTPSTSEIQITTSAEINTASNLGAGTGVFASKVGVDLQFKSLTEGAHIDFTSTSTEINAKVKNIATPQLNWVKDTNGPITEFVDGFLFESFDNVSAQEIYAIINVPNTYAVGSQITLKNGEFFCAGVSPSTVQFQSISTLINSTTVLGTYTNNYTSTNGAVTLSATSNLITSIGNIDLTNASGQINAVAVQPGDKIRVKLYRIASGSTSDARLIMDSLEPYFE